jgi:hypothetical protein
MTNDPRVTRDDETDGGIEPAEPVVIAGSAPALAAEETDDADDDDEDYELEPRRGVVQISKVAFWSIIGVGALAILALAAATAWLALDRGGSNDPVVATVNGEQIKRSEYDRAVASANGGDILDGLIAERLVTSEAKKRNITLDDAETERLVNEQRDRFGGDAGLQSALSQAGLSMEDLTKQLRLSELLRRMVADKTAVTDQDVETAYNANKDRYQGQTLDQARDQVRTDLSQQKERSAVQDFLAQARSDAKIETKLPGKDS